MRIIGVGHDVVELDRIRRSLEQFGESFMARCFTAEERRFCSLRRDPVPGLAARFAAKEAGAKALGTGISGGVGFLEIDRTGCLLDVNATALRLFGYSKERMLMRPVFEAFGMNREDFEHLLDRALAHHGPITLPALQGYRLHGSVAHNRL